jgi:hypothetical protein
VGGRCVVAAVGGIGLDAGKGGAGSFLDGRDDYRKRVPVPRVTAWPCPRAGIGTLAEGDERSAFDCGRESLTLLETGQPEKIGGRRSAQMGSRSRAANTHRTEFVKPLGRICKTGPMF